MAEPIIAGMLLTSRNMPEALNFISGLEENAQNINSQIEGHKKHFAGFEVSGKTTGVLGLGAIGVRVAYSAASFGLNTIGFDPFISPKYWRASNLIDGVLSVCVFRFYDC